MAAWYCLIGDKEYGPFSSERIQSLVEKGKLTKDHFVRPSTDTQWTAASDIPGLFPAKEAKAASSKAASPKAKQPKSPPPTKTKPPVAAEASKPPMAAALPVTSEEPEMPSALPVAAPVATPIATPVAAPTSLPVGTPVVPASAAVPATAPAKDSRETIAYVRKKSKQQQYLVAGGLAAVLIVLGVVALIALNRSPDKESEEDQVAQSTPDQTETAAPIGDIEADPEPETDPAAEEPASKRVDGKKPAILPPISRWLDASRNKGILRISDSMIRFHVVNVWLDSGEPGSRTLTVELTVTNGSSSDSLDFRGWTLAEDASINDGVVLADDKDQRLSASGRAANTRSTARRLKPKESVKDQLVFEAPTGEYEHLRLYLPYAAIGRTGHIGFEIPGVMIKDHPPGVEEPVAMDPKAPKPNVSEPEMDNAVPKPAVVIKPPTPPKPEDPFSMDVLRNSIEESMGDGDEPKPESKSIPFPSGTPEQPKMMDGSGPTADEDDQMGERAEEE